MNGSGRPHAAFFPDGDPAQTTGGGIGGSRILSMADLELADGGASPEDGFGHGTRMSSIAAGAKFNALPDVDDGFAPEARIRSYKISHDLLSGGLASTAVMMQAFNAAAAEPDVLVINMSYFGSPQPQLAPEKAIDNASLAGVFVSLAGGNSGTNLASAHGAYNAIASGGSDEAVKQPSNVPGLYVSAIGPLPDGRRYPHLLGLGISITCAVFDAESTAIESCCTSAASAMIAGTALLVRQADPLATQLETKALLLNSSLEVTLGNPAARGFGYLHARRAVDAALAGEVVSEALDATQKKKFDVPLTAGQDVAFTLVWNRENTALTAASNLDLVVRAPGGGTVASSTSPVNNVEQVRFTAPSTGTYRVIVSPVSTLGPSTTFALAGTGAHSVDDGQGCPGGPPVVASVQPLQVPAVAEPNPVALSGCNLSGVTGVTLGGVPATSFTSVDDKNLSVELPFAPALGPVPLEVTTPTGTASFDLDVQAPPPTLASVAQFLGAGQPLEPVLAGAPGSLSILFASIDSSPTVLPGLVSLDIGGGGASLALVTQVVLPASSWQQLSLGPLQPSPGFGTLLFLQAVEVDLVQLSLPLPTTSVESTLVLF